MQSPQVVSPESGLQIPKGNMRWGGQARSNIPRGCYRRSYEEGLQLVDQCFWGCCSLVYFCLPPCYLEQGSLSWTEPLLQSPPCYSRSHGGRTTTLSPNPQGWDPSLWVVLESPFSQGPNHIRALRQDKQHTATAGFLYARPCEWRIQQEQFYSCNDLTSGC